MAVTPAPGPTVPERMTPRARAYMSIVAARHVLVGLACIVLPDHFTSTSYDVLKGFLGTLLSPDQTLVAWGCAFVAVGSLAAYAAVTGREEPARSALRASVTTTALWAGGFLAVIFTGASAGWSGVIVWTALAAKDLTMLRDPLRNPFEDLVRSDTRAGG